MKIINKSELKNTLFADAIKPGQTVLIPDYDQPFIKTDAPLNEDNKVCFVGLETGVLLGIYANKNVTKIEVKGVIE